ncbi:hypothetical protein ANN_26609 [Periplaneta americana]|uniref:Uncharacterized protein n=1 Tax=Periplaneta americana TaxID=6978 RepID=A0ABQ8RZ33_PERAM|nr:hypothetical protein ANN_26609 [Periplaneta americana]
MDIAKRKLPLRCTRVRSDGKERYMVSRETLRRYATCRSESNTNGTKFDSSGTGNIRRDAVVRSEAKLEDVELKDDRCNDMQSRFLKLQYSGTPQIDTAMVRVRDESQEVGTETVKVYEVGLYLYRMKSTTAVLNQEPKLSEQHAIKVRKKRSERGKLSPLPSSPDAQIGQHRPSCRHITFDVLDVIKMSSYQCFLYLRIKKKVFRYQIRKSALPYGEGWVERRKILSGTVTRTPVFSFTC